jgi:hypothetical protein
MPAPALGTCPSGEIDAVQTAVEMVRRRELQPVLVGRLPAGRCSIAASLARPCSSDGRLDVPLHLLKGNVKSTLPPRKALDLSTSGD